MLETKKVLRPRPEVESMFCSSRQLSVYIFDVWIDVFFAVSRGQKLEHCSLYKLSPPHSGGELKVIFIDSSNSSLRHIETTKLLQVLMCCRNTFNENHKSDLISYTIYSFSRYFHLHVFHTSYRIYPFRRTRRHVLSHTREPTCRKVSLMDSLTQRSYPSCRRMFCDQPLMVAVCLPSHS